MSEGDDKASWSRLSVALAVILLIALVGTGSFFLGRHSATQNAPAASGLTTATGPTPSQSVDWTGEYFWEDSAQDDAVLLTLLENPSGVTCTWTETALDASTALALNGTETAIPPNNSFSVEVTINGSASLSITVGNYGRATFEVYSTVSGIQLQYTPQGGGIAALAFNRVTGTQEYDQASQAIAASCNSGSVYCGQGT